MSDDPWTQHAKARAGLMANYPPAEPLKDLVPGTPDDAILETLKEIVVLQRNQIELLEYMSGLVRRILNRE